MCNFVRTVVRSGRPARARYQHPATAQSCMTAKAQRILGWLVMGFVRVEVPQCPVTAKFRRESKQNNASE